MSKKLKAIICALTAGMMLTTSVGFTAFAEELNADGSAAETETVLAADGSEAVATEEPETFNGADVEEDEADAARLADEAAEQATEEPEATPEPKSYDDDTYYQNALKVCSALGIITGYDDGSVKPESTVTRAEMATIILRMIAIAGDSTYQNVFTDVTSAHWAANTIQTAVEQSIVDGMGDGTFVPDGPVKYEQVIKMIVCAMNYGTDAENAGGYPAGYLAIGGSTLKLLTGVTGAAGEDMPRGEVIKAVYNALRASYRDIKEFKNGYPVYETKDTLGIEKFDMYEEEGVLTTTPNITIASGTTTKNGIITIDGVDYKCDFNVDEYVASKIKFYYIDDKNDDSKVIAMFSMGKSVENTFKDVDIDSIDTSAGTLKAYTSSTSSSTKKYDIKNATVIYNDTIMTTADYAAYNTDPSRSFDDFIKPAVGSVRIVDYDNDGTYDIIFVDSYETMLVTNATTEKLTGKIKNVNTTIEYDLDDNDYEITVIKNDVNASVKNLRKNDVASIKRNLAGDKMTIVVTGENVTGTITAIGEDDGETTITVNGQTFKVDENAVADMQNGLSGTFYLDQFDRVGYASLTSTLNDNERYAMIAKAYYNDEAELVIRLYNQDGEQIEAKPAGSMKYWAPNASAASKSPSEETLNSDLNTDSKFVQCGSYPVKLCKYTLNSSGEISKLYVATGMDKVEESDYNNALVMYTKDKSSTDTAKTASLRNVSAVGGTLNGYSINDGIVGFTVPDTAADRGSGANYSTSSVSASRYKSYDGGVDRDFAIGGFTTGSTKSAQVVVEFTTSSTSMWQIKELDTASIRPGMLVSKINEAVDSEGETIYEIKGYQNGSEVSYYTTDTSSLYKYTGWNDKKYGGTLLFDATGETKSAAVPLTSVLKPGDMISIAADGTNIRTMIIMAAAADVAKAAVGAEVSELKMSPNGSGISSSRQTYYMGFVDSINIDDLATISTRNYDGSSTGAVTYSTSQVFTLATLTVDESGNVKDTKLDKSGGIEASEFYEFGTDDTFDYIICSSLKGNMSSGYIIRVEIDR